MADVDVDIPRRRKAWRAGLIAGAMLLAVLAAVTGGVQLAVFRMVKDINRIPDPFTAISALERPPAGPGLVFLLAGIDTGIEQPTTGEQARVEPAGRSDVLMLVRIAADRSRITVVSIPRDAWVPIPGRGHGKVNAAFAYGGPTLAVRTVERLTALRIDHVAVVDFAGFEGLIDALGGVHVQISEETYDAAQGVRWTPGDYRLDGERALQYVRQRDGLPRGDLDRIKRQQNVLRAVIERLAAKGTLVNPVRLARVVNAIGRTVSIDSGMDERELRDLILGLRNMASGYLSFVTVPALGPGKAGGQSVIRLDQRRGHAFWRAVGSDDLGTYMLQNPLDELGGTVP